MITATGTVSIESESALSMKDGAIIEGGGVKVGSRVLVGIILN
jgi:hypothetical protein